MEVKGKRYIIHPSRSDSFTIWNLSDLHWWSKATDEKGIREDIETVKNDPYSFWLGGGDYSEAIGFTDKRFDPDCVPDRIKVSDLGKIGWVQANEIKDLFTPIKGKCLGLLLGNHEKHLQLKKEQSHLHSWLCAELQVPNLEYSALFDVVFCRTGKTIILQNHSPGRSIPRESFRFFVHHGAGFATTPGGKLNKLIGFMDSFDADIYMIGHVHDQTARRQVTIGANAECTKLIQHVKLGVISGSYLKTYAQGNTSYGEQRAYRPTVLGAAKVTIKPENREFYGEI